MLQEKVVFFLLIVVSCSEQAILHQEMMVR